MGSYENPILPGFFPDPSCILVDDTYYMVNSSFQFFPGIPIHTSTDLINWTYIGNAISRPSQLNLDSATTKVNNAAKNEIFTAGLYAPTIRHHAGTFYIICTNLSGSTDMSPTQDFTPENFIITTTDIHNPSKFSNLISFSFHGIDPSLFFDDDDDGKAYVQGSWIHGYDKHPATVIRQCEIDPDTGIIKSPLRDIWEGATRKVPEGPHMYRKDGWYYLLAAEGGTHRGHQITMSRSRSICGPYEGCERNPVLQAESDDAITQCVGHGELFQDREERWWAVMLARREHGSSFPLGRETYMVPVEWREGEFPVFSAVQMTQKCDRPVAAKMKITTSEVVTLGSPKTLFLRSPQMGNYTQEGEDILLRATKSQITAPSGTLTFMGQRQTSLNSLARVTIASATENNDVYCGISVYKDTFRHVSVEYSVDHKRISLMSKTPTTEWEAVATHSGIRLPSIQLKIESSVESYVFSFSYQNEEGRSADIVLGEVPCSTLSGDDFTGPVYAIYASGDENTIKFRDFRVENL